jgi:two-component sensor histidine kinase
MFKKLINLGVTAELDPYQKRETRVLNVIALIIVFGLLVGFTNILFLKSLYPYAFNLAVLLGMVSILFLNHRKHYSFALYAFLLTILTTLVYVGNYYDRSTGTMVYFFPVIFCIALLHNPNKPRYHLAIRMGLIVIGFYFSQTVQLPFITPGDFSNYQIILLRYYNLYFTVIVTIVMVFLLTRLVGDQHREVNQLIKKLEDNQAIVSGSLKEKEVLLKEVQHRVKNNLAVLIGLFNFQRDAAPSEEVKTALNEAKNRVLSIAMVHQQLYGKSNLSRIDLKVYISELTTEVLNTHPLFSHVEVKQQLEAINIDITKAVPIGLIINEIITNSFKHAFKNISDKPAIEIQLKLIDKTVHLTIKDNGKGFPENLSGSNNSLGHTLIEALTDQIDGNVRFLNNNGAQVEMSFPLS